ncbi:MAG: chemotaxis protein CheD [Zymomonas mobilis subsp. pomaceae]|uniref:Probable chemoreceptor glutamine deamidase CheD n=1 Tax=Zymomonas mobilis subsp. pomaceae (strain ATCC 29192 / DSM 22645 / JCM 10191 / CCUG 17912 / NBRC 13757 / NCIMB 11200 / NRRL B-4491 / Barker I) TaxID=579138 RepID=F8ETH8_ZYMMT|nr:chemotaxis protein CheD [Zymomonas mobilis]AEI38003.1 CheD, stimulates methylation of MCP protein [Zymomonas mobilis subsp. pomaceae ATCC 29192]MDX5949371.1 chemotaxis protein CheD [Zymomonas mobilis subsp. pomaceae]GEB89113.1 putative chemoreceptor glutamine deamidase CheD [Zymomonas mobilis subsp. pomaceae]
MKVNIADFRRIDVLQGDKQVSDQPDVLFSTVLGSCISACLFDPLTKIGGMNHFLLAEPTSRDHDPQSLKRYGVYAMEVLINAMLERGAHRNRLRARLYGGATMRSGFGDIGYKNAEFARRFLKDEHIALTAEDIGGVTARRVDFCPGLGLARCRHVENQRPVERLEVVPTDSGDVTFF